MFNVLELVQERYMSRGMFSPYVGDGAALSLPGADVLTLIKEVDGPGSGLDADLVDGKKVTRANGGARDVGNAVIELSHIDGDTKVSVDGVDVLTLADAQSITDANNSNVSGLANVTYLQHSGYNSFGMLADGNIYTTSGTDAASGNYGTGRGIINTNSSVGIDNLFRVPIPSDSPVVEYVADGLINCALLANKELWVWGYNTNGQLGLGHTANVGIPALTSTNVEEVYLDPSSTRTNGGDKRLFIRKSDGNIYGAGYNGQGQLGIGNTTTQTSWVQITALGTNQVSKLWNLGATTGCTIVLMTDGRILAAGHNGYGQLGIGNTTHQTSFVDITLQWAGVSSVLDLKVTGNFTWYNGVDTYEYRSFVMMMITLPAGNIVRMAGANPWYNLGDGTTTQRTSPVTPTGLPTDIVDIATVAAVTCQVLTSTGDLWAWGHNAQGQVGNGLTSYQTTPLLIRGGVAKLLSNSLTAALEPYLSPVFTEDTNGRLLGTGYNYSGYLGIGNNNTSITTFTETLLPKDEQVHLLGLFSTGRRASIIVCVTKKNNMYAWGYNGHRGLYGKTNARGPNPFPMQIRMPRKNKSTLY